MTEIENIIRPFFNEKFGSDLQSRMRKLFEEVNELQEAVDIHSNATDPADRIYKLKHLLDEIGDVQAVLSHITLICGANFQRILTNTYVKIKVREIDKTFLKSK